MFRRTLFLFLMFANLLFFGGIGCFGSSNNNGASNTSNIATIEVTSNEDTLLPGESLQLTVVARDADGNIVANAKFVFDSDYPEFASVDADGQVDALYPGDVQITASSNGVVSNPFSLLVSPPENSQARTQLTDNILMDDWGPNNFWKMTSRRKILWQQTDGVDTDVLLHHLDDAVGDNDILDTILNMEVDFMALGSGASSSDYLASWRVNNANTFVSDDGGTPVDLMDQNQEENSIANGCFFFREGGGFHDIQLYSVPAGLNEVEDQGDLYGPIGSFCQAVWEKRQGATSDLIFFDGVNQTTLTTGLPNFPQYDFRQGQVVYARNGDIFHVDTTTTPFTTTQITNDGLTVFDQGPKTDGISIVWDQINGLEENILMYNRITGEQETLSNNTGIKVASTLQIDQKQVVWRECDALPCSNANAHLMFHDGSGEVGGTDEIPLGGIPTEVSFNPFIDSGIVTWIGNDGDTEVFVWE